MSIINLLIDLFKNELIPDWLKKSVMEMLGSVINYLLKQFTWIPTHYGCPNSKRTAKLQLKKKRSL